jgi:hypothetical protein
VQAQWYAGLGAGQSQSDINAVWRGDTNLADANINIDDSALGWKIFAGIQLSDTLAMELDYTDLGEYEGSGNISNAIHLDTRIETSLVSLSGLAHYHIIDPIGQGQFLSFSLFGRAGVYRWSGDVLATIRTFGSEDTVSSSGDGTRLNFGLGAQAGFGPAGMRFEWQRFNNITDSLDYDLFILSGILKF